MPGSTHNFFSIIHKVISKEEQYVQDLDIVESVRFIRHYYIYTGLSQ